MASWIGCGVADLFPRSLCAATPDSNDDALREICQRGFAPAAVAYCRSQVALHNEKPPQRSRWLMRLMECQCQAALQAGVDAQAAWDQVAKLESDYRQQYADDPRLPWLAWQLSRGELLRSQQALARWLATPAAVAQREEALQSVRRLQSQIDALDADIKARLPLTLPKAGSPPSQVPSRELQELSVDSGLLRCEALLVRARCYELGSPDRLAALAEVERLAGEMLSRAQPDWSSRDELMVARAAAGLEVGKRTESFESLTAILLGKANATATGSTTGGANLPNPAGSLPESISPRTRMKAGTVAIEALCSDRNANEQSLSIANRLQQELNSHFVGPEVELSQIQLQLAHWQRLPPRERAQQLPAIVEAAQQLGARYGAYWRNRGEALLVATASSAGTSTTPTPDIEPNRNNSTASKPDSSSQKNTPDAAATGLQELVQIEVRQLLAGGQVEAAITRLRTAIGTAKSSGQVSQALDLALEAARLMGREKRWQEAADLLEPMAVELPEDPNAPAAHVLAAWCLAQALQDKRVSSDKPLEQTIETRYERMLVEQLKRWPNSSHSLKAEEYLVGWYTRKRRFDDLCSMWFQRAEQLAAVSQVETASSALHHWLTTLIGRVPKAQVSPQINRLIESVSAGKFQACERSAILVAFSAAMLTAPLTIEEAEQLVHQKLPGQLLEQTSSDQAILAALGALASARRGDAAATHSVLKTLDTQQLDTIIHLAWCKAMAESLDELSPAQVANWQSALELVTWPSDTPPSTPALKMADLRLKQLRTKDAATASQLVSDIKALATQHASDANLQLVYAAAIAQHSDASQPATFDEAIRIVKRVAVGANKQSEAYWRSRWLEIRWRIGRGEKSVAAQIARLTLASQSIEQPWLKKRFETIAAIQ